MQDKASTPLNIAEGGIELEGFRFEQAIRLLDDLEGFVGDSGSLMQSILNWTGGQPFLTQKLCQLVVSETNSSKVNVDELVDNYIISNWEYQDEPKHLRPIRDRILGDSYQYTGRLLELYRHILEHGKIIADDSSEQKELRLSGLVVKQDGVLKVFNRIYEQVFNQQWVDKRFDEIRPYSKAITDWKNSDRKSLSSLLRGKELRQAQEWSAGRSLSVEDYQFLEEGQRNQARLIIQRAVQVSGVLLAISLPAAAMATWQAATATREAAIAQRKAGTAKQEARVAEVEKQDAKRELKTAQVSLQEKQQEVEFAQTNLKKTTREKKQAEVARGQALQARDNARTETIQAVQSRNVAVDQAEQAKRIRQQAVKETRLAKEITRLEQLAASSLRDFEFTQIDALLSAMTAVQDLKKLSKGKPSLTDYPTSTPWSTLLSILPNLREKHRLIHQGFLSSVVFSPDGELLASASSGSIKLWRKNGSLVKTLLGHNAFVSSVSFSPDGKLIASASLDKTIKLWKRDGSLVSTLRGHKDSVNSVRFSPNGQLLVSSSDDKTIKLWQRDGKLVATFALPPGSVEQEDARFSQDGKTISSLDRPGQTVNQKTLDGTLLPALTGKGFIVNLAVSDPKQKTIVTGNNDGTIDLLRPDGTIASKFGKAYSGPVRIVEVSRDGQLIASAHSDNTIKIWERNGSLVMTLTGHSNAVRSLRFSPNGKLLASASYDGTVRLWKLDERIGVTTFRNLDTSYSRSEEAVVVSSNGQIIATVESVYIPDSERVFAKSPKPVNLLGKRDVVKLRKLDGTVISTLDDNEKPVGIREISLSSDGKLIATADSNGTIKLWKLDGTLIKVLTGLSETSSIRFSPDGRLIAFSVAKYSSRGNLLNGGVTITAESSQVKIWNYSANQILAVESSSTGLTYDIAFSPDGKLLASAGSDRKVKLWRQNGTLIKTTARVEDYITKVNFSPDGKWLASGTEGGRIYLWKHDGSLVVKLNAHNDAVNDIAFSPDGKMLASSGADKAVKLWKLDNSRLSLITSLNAHPSSVRSLAFHSDGKTLISASIDPGLVLSAPVTVIQWDLDLDRLLARGCVWLKDYIATHPDSPKVCSYR